MGGLIGLMLWAPVASAAPIDLAKAVNTRVLAGEPDAACVGGDLAAGFDLDVNAPIAALNLTVWQAEGSAPGGTLIVTFAYPDGTTSRAVAIEGQQFGPGLVSGLFSLGLHLGPTSSGGSVPANQWQAPSRAARAIVTRVHVEAHTPSPVCVMSVETVGSVDLASGTDTHDWYPFTVSAKLTSQIPQLSPLEAPAGKHGFLTHTPDGHFAYTDGTRARFWGMNLVNVAAMPEKAQADNYAAELAQLGFNIVRLHHIDGVGPGGVVNAKRTADPATWLDPVQTDKLDYFISRLEAHGVYIYAEVATAREFTAQDGVPNPGGLPNGFKLATMWSQPWQAAYLSWFRVFWGRTNPYTNLRYADDPGVALLELSNEHSLLMNWGIPLEQLPKAQLAWLTGAWNLWLRARYPTEAALATAWTSGARFDGLQPGESFHSEVAREPAIPALFEQWPTQRRRDLYEFYASLEAGFYAAVAERARSLGFHIPIVPSIAYDQPILQSLYKDYDATDTHVEWDQPTGPAFTNESALAHPESLLARMATAMVGKPAIMSEVNQPFPNAFRAEAPLLWAALLSNQDWDGALWFSWLDSPWSEDNATVVGTNDLRSNTLALVQMATASSVFRAFALPTARGESDLVLDPDAIVAGFLTNQHLRPIQSRPLELLDLPFLLTHRIRTSFAGNFGLGIPANPEIGWWADPGVLVLDRPMVEARVGPPGAEWAYGHGTGLRQPAGLHVHLANWAAVALASADGQRLGMSHAALLTVATRQENTGETCGAQGTELIQAGEPPILVEPARGSVWFRWPTRPLVRPLDPSGAPMPPIPVRAAREAGLRGWRVDLSAVRSPWLTVTDPD